MKLEHALYKETAEQGEWARAPNIFKILKSS